MLFTDALLVSSPGWHKARGNPELGRILLGLLRFTVFEGMAKSECVAHVCMKQEG